MTRREDMIAGPFELGGWALVGILMGISYAVVGVFGFFGLILYWLGIIK